MISLLIFDRGFPCHLKYVLKASWLRNVKVHYYLKPISKTVSFCPGDLLGAMKKDTISSMEMSSLTYNLLNLSL